MVVAFGVVTTYLTPIVLDPLFNKFTPLPDGPTRSTVLSLAREAGVDVGQVYVMDASRRTTAANAYVTGIGRTKRVVLYDTLLKDFTPGEVRLVVAHELGHVHHRDVPHGLLYLALVAPFGMFAVARLGERLAPRDSLGTAAAVPAVVLAVGLIGAGDHRRSPTSSRAASSSARTSSRSSSPASRRRSSASRSGSRSRTSRTRTRRRSRSSCSAPTRRRWSGSAWRGASSRSQGWSGSGGGVSGRFLIPSVVRHLDQLSSMASISSRKKRGERFMRETTTPGTSPSSTSWSTRAKVIENS